MFPPTVIIGLHGILRRSPWFDRVVEQYRGAPDEDGDEGSVEEELLSLALDRAGAYGWQTVSRWLTENGRVTARHEPTAWAHEEAGGDWTPDGRVRQLAWLQAGALTDPPRLGLPVRPIALVLAETLARVGTVTFTGLHALLPLPAARRNTAFHQTELAPWFALADPDARHEVVVTVSGRPGKGAVTGDDAAAVREAVREMADGAVEVLPPGAHSAASVTSPAGPPGLDLDLGRGVHTEGMREAFRFGCAAREWSPDLAVWLVEMVADALRAAGRVAPVVVTASLVLPPA
ncbi:hypothetical protein [Streptomyces endophytica]|uniref:Uncharacterized protein n=1 Tax=Streptomyces endophytica TaxID=2991496 RepID=A0ABY6PBN9_9ACTN|nr:hypothetical protein [Streptomyces endophytica]UZJ30977.1 hypothetical protein OJ254_12285 [Streptomyces endophytica]